MCNRYWYDDNPPPFDFNEESILNFSNEFFNYTTEPVNTHNPRANLYKICGLTDKIFIENTGEAHDFRDYILIEELCKEFNKEVSDFIVVSQNHFLDFKENKYGINHLVWDDVLISCPKWIERFFVDLDFNNPREKKFLFLNNNFRIHRFKMINELSKIGLDDLGFISLASLNGAKSDLGKWWDNNKEDHEIFKIAIEMQKSQINFNFWQNKFNYTLDIHNLEGIPPTRFLNLDNTYLKNTYFSIVAETWFENDRKKLLVTEKSFKHSVSQPFIMLGAPNQLKVLHSFGLETFSELFDESYDEIEDDNDRFLFVFNEIERVSRMSHTELKKIIKGNIVDKLLHNRDVLLNFDLGTYLKNFYTNVKIKNFQ